MMTKKILITLLFLLISNLVFAQSTASGGASSPAVSVISISSDSIKPVGDIYEIEVPVSASGGQTPPVEPPTAASPGSSGGSGRQVQAVEMPQPVAVTPVVTSSGGGGYAQPAAVALPSDLSVKISPSEAKPVMINEKPVEFRGVEATPAISLEVKTASTSGGAGGQVPATATVKVNVDEENKQTTIESSGATAVTQEVLKFEASELKIETPKGDFNVNVLPGTATQSAVSSEPQKVEAVELKVVEDKPVYEISGIKEAKLLWIIPVNVAVTTQISAESGETIKSEKPWWSFLAW